MSDTLAEILRKLFARRRSDGDLFVDQNTGTTVCVVFDGGCCATDVCELLPAEIEILREIGAIR